MHRGWFVGGVLAILLGLGIAGPRIRADDLRPVPSPAPEPAPVVDNSVGPQVPFIPGDAVLAPGPPDGAPKHRSFREWASDCLHANVPILCWAHHNGLGCGNIVSEFNFVFGSCRTFYGEPCFTRPPPLPVPQGYGPGYGYGAGDAGKCPCRQD
jgi:hypothetical protein